MLTDNDIKEYYASLGISLPDAIITCITSQVNKVGQCLIDNGADECQIKLALLMASGLIGISMGARMISSESVDVLSHSFKYQSLEDLQDMLRNNLRVLDKWGCTKPIIPADVSNNSFIMSATGCRKCRS